MDPGQVHLSPRIRRKLVKLWYFRQELVLSKLWKERRECEYVIMGGVAGKLVSPYLGSLGELHWVRDGKGTPDDLCKYRNELRAYAVRRLAILAARIEKVEALRPPSDAP